MELGPLPADVAATCVVSKAVVFVGRVSLRRVVPSSSAASLSLSASFTLSFFLPGTLQRSSGEWDPPGKLKCEREMRLKPRRV